MSIQTPLAKVKHLGPAGHHATDHHIKQRVTAIFMIPLAIWFVVTVVCFIQKNMEDLPWFITSPVTIIGAVLFVLNAFYHASLGLRMVIEDYVHCKSLRIASLLVMYGFVITTVVAGLVAIFSIYILLRIG
jgi:succinate dehydrogenase / fumarate reductase membrane anchor subunit